MLLVCSLSANAEISYTATLVSDYVFEEYAAHFLEANPELKIEFEAMKVRDAEFNENAYAQLNWIYKRSPLYEKSHLTYTVYRVIN